MTVHCIGRHSRGFQAVRVHMQSGWLVLVSDAAHFYEILTGNKPFPIDADAHEMLDGFDTLEILASEKRSIGQRYDPMLAVSLSRSRVD
ncbi:MAG: hypothetical protein AAF393_16060 [Pseudomonadota bacterium]